MLNKFNSKVMAHFPLKISLWKVDLLIIISQLGINIGQGVFNSVGWPNHCSMKVHLLFPRLYINKWQIKRPTGRVLVAFILWLPELWLFYFKVRTLSGIHRSVKLPHSIKNAWSEGKHPSESPLKISKWTGYFKLNNRRKTAAEWLFF